MILLFPMGIVGLLISPDSQSGMRVFLPICAWAASASAILPYCYLQIAVHHRIRRLFLKNSNGNGALIKSSEAVDRLPNVTDLVLLGRGAISDGRRHFVSAFMGDGVLSVEDEQSESLTSLCEAFCLLEDARSRLPLQINASLEQTEPYLNELIAKSGFDREALAVRVSKTELFRGRQEQILDVEGADGAFRLRFYQTPTSLFGCGHYLRSNGTLGILDLEKRSAYEAFVRHAAASGQRTVTVVRAQRGTVVLLGCLALGECYLRDLTQTVSHFEQKGIRVRLFLKEENAENMVRAAICLPQRAVRRRSQIGDLHRVTDDERVFVGYSDQQIAERIRMWRRKGRVIGAVSCDADDRLAMAAASVTVGCDWFNEENDARCNPILQRDADLLVAGASSLGGGLQAVKEAIFGLQQTAGSINRFVGRLFLLRVLQTVFMLLSVVLGMGYVPAYAVLYSSLFVDAFLLAQTLREEKAMPPQTRSMKNPFVMLKQGNVWPCVVILPVALTVIMRIFYGMELLSLEHCYLSIFISLMLTESLVLTLGDLRLKLYIRTWRDLLILWLPVIGVIALSAVLPQIVGITELDAKNALAWILPGFGACVEAALLLLLPKNKR